MRAHDSGFLLGVLAMMLAVGAIVTAIGTRITEQTSAESTIGEGPQLHSGMLLGGKVRGASFGLVDDPTCAIDQTVALKNALAAAAGRELELGKGTICLGTTASTLTVAAPNSVFSGQGSSTVIKYAAPAGSETVPLLDITSTATKSLVRDISFDGNAAAGSYVDSTYFGTGKHQPLGGATVVIQADDTKISNVSARNGFDNCFYIGAIAHNEPVRGAPKRVQISNVNTAHCGSGNHVAGGPGKIGAGIDNGSGYATSISNATDYQSYGSYIADIGAGGFASWSNITSIQSRVNPSNKRIIPALYVGESNNIFSNISIIEPEGHGVWSDYYANGSMYVNVNIKSPSGPCLLIKGPGMWSNITCSDPGYFVKPERVPALVLDTSAGDIVGLMISNLSIQAAAWAPSAAIVSVGSNDVLGRITGFDYPGTIATDGIDRTIKSLALESIVTSGQEARPERALRLGGN